mmetsp:Transcript_3965/g.5850  ORF Transcript_3965/g.5850 Transcript_3965/m.5850 type:complete len:101 (-) Transcript_3965:206-508(-)
MLFKYDAKNATFENDCDVNMDTSSNTIRFSSPNDISCVTNVENAYSNCTTTCSANSIIGDDVYTCPVSKNTMYPPRNSVINDPIHIFSIIPSDNLYDENL